MPYVSEKDYKKLAEAVADDLINNSVPLNDSVTKLAQQMDLNQEQIKRLCETTNNVTFNKMFQSRDKTAQDRMIEFPIADSKVVLGNFIDNARGEGVDLSKTAAYELRELDDERHVDVTPDMTKTAFELRPTAKVNKEADARTLRKVHEHLCNEKLATDMAYRDGLADLRNQFRKIYDVTPWEQFEKDAAALFGSKAEPVLNDVRALMGLPAVSYDLVAICKTAGYVDDTTSEMQLFSGLIKHATHSLNLAKGIAKIEKSL